MRKNLLVPMIALLIAICAITACTKTETTEKLEPALFKGQSEHWKLQVKYELAEAELVEMVSLAFMGSDSISEAAVTITHNNQGPMTYHVIEPLILKTGQAITLGEKGKVKSWKDMDQLVVEWKVDGTQFKEYMTPAKVEDASAPK
jgi:hypothetical protein